MRRVFSLSTRTRNRVSLVLIAAALLIEAAQLGVFAEQGVAQGQVYQSGFVTLALK